MWLQSIQHTGEDTYGTTNSNISLNQVTFIGTEIDNRVNDARPAAPPLYRPRMSSIQTEAGESTAVEYNQTPCAGVSLSTSTADSNTHACYPVYWTVPGDSKPIADWFNKTTVSSVTVIDLTGAANFVPNGRRPEVPAGSRASGHLLQLRGPGLAPGRLGADRRPVPHLGPVPRFPHGHGADRGGTRPGHPADDHVSARNGRRLQGRRDAPLVSRSPRRPAAARRPSPTPTARGTALATDNYTGPAAPSTPNHRQSHYVPDHRREGAECLDLLDPADNPGASQPTLSTLPDLTAYRIKTSHEHDYDLLAKGGWRHSETDTGYDLRGRVVSVDDHGDLSDTSQEKCATTAYATEPSANTMMWSYPDQVTSHSGPCSDPVTAANLISDAQT